MRLRNQAHRGLGFGADRIEARRVQDHQALSQQGVRDVDERVPPARDLDPAVGVGYRVVLGRVVVPEAQRARLLLRDALDLGHLLHRRGELFGVAHVQIDPRPSVGRLAPFEQGARFEPGLDRQQPQARWQFGVVAQFGRAHGRAARAGRHDAPPVAGEEQRVDQFGLAARELGDESHHHLVGAHLGFEPAQAFLHRGIQQLVLAHPFGQQLQPQGELLAPGAVVIELLMKGCGHRGLREVTESTELTKYSIRALRGARMPHGPQGFWHTGQ